MPAITLPVPATAKDWQRGSGDAPITLVEYGDFQCEDSQAAYPILKRLWEENGARVRFVYRHLPLTDVHLHALDAAKASEATGLRDRFWEMHDALYASSSPLTREN